MTVNSDTSAGGRIRVFYPGPGIVVTSLYIETGKARYRVRDLVVLKPRYIYAHTAREVALYCGLVELLLGGAAGAVLGSAATLIPAGVVAALGLTGAIWIDDLRNPRRMQLVAWHDGRRVVLFESTNERVFGQVRRAVLRALEAGRRPRP
jgi:hypothetical protein